MTLNDTIELVSQGVVPNQIIFQLNEDKSTYSVDCMYDSIKVNGEYKKVISHSDKVSFPKDADLSVSTRGNEKVWFDIIIPNDEEEKEND